MTDAVRDLLEATLAEDQRRLREYSQAVGRRVGGVGLLILGVFAAITLGDLGKLIGLVAWVVAVAELIGIPSTVSSLTRRSKEIADDLLDSRYCQITGQIEMEEGEASQRVSIGDVGLEFAGPLELFRELWSQLAELGNQQRESGGDEYPMRRSSSTMPTVTMDYTKHSEILLRIRDSDGNSLYRYSQYDPQGEIC